MYTPMQLPGLNEQDIVEADSLLKANVEAQARTFAGMTWEDRIDTIFLYIVLFYLIIAWLGVNTSLFVALFAAAGLAIGMAMSGVFQNFAGGVMILLLKPFRVGDRIELQGQAGSVIDIRLLNAVNAVLYKSLPENGFEFISSRIEVKLTQ